MPCRSKKHCHVFRNGVAPDPLVDPGNPSYHDQARVSPHPTVYPGVRIVGRLASDPPGEMTTPEVILANGGMSATCKDNNHNVVGCRWGDYSAIRMDPADGC